MATEVAERRRFQRVKLLRPVPGRLDVQKIYILNISVSGARIAHQKKFLNAGDLILSFSHDGADMEFECRVIWTEVEKSAKGGKKVLHSGVAFLRSRNDSHEHLREMIAASIMRALDEQKANARGVPPLTTTYRQTAAAHEGYIRCTYLGNRWTRVQTDKPDQPVNGFTVSAMEEPSHIDMLCSTFEVSDENGRKMIRQMAELSVSKAEGFATRHFNP